jgi:molybdopterin-guanine dinucleotide biosynthesis protein A
VIGALLAGGSGRRLGAPSKPAALLAGQPLISYPAAALLEVCPKVAVVCKSSTPLPPLEGVERWDEPDEPRHPLTGIVHALTTAGGPVLICAADMPFVTADACRSLLQGGPNADAVIATAEGVLQPTLGLYAASALDALRAAPPDAALTATVEALDTVRVALPAALVRSVNTPEELAEAEAALASS